MIVLAQGAWDMVNFVVSTPSVLLPPSIANKKQELGKTEQDDDKKRKWMDILDQLNLPPLDRSVVDNWVNQLIWMDGRANRERAVNDLIRWWQVVLSVLIPVLISNADTRNLGIQNSTWASVASLFVAIITAIYQFRSPDKYWRHYRILHETYLDELWSYIALSSDKYPPEKSSDDSNGELIPQTHQAAFKRFNTRMSAIRQDEVQRFFSEVAFSNQKAIEEALAKNQVTPMVPS